MNDFWWIIILSIGALIGGFILSAGIYGLYNFFKDWNIKRKLPKDKKELSEYLSDPQNKQWFENPGKEVLNEKEVLEDEERRRAKFREFEKLRRSANARGNNRGLNQNSQYSGNNTGAQGRGTVPLQSTQVNGSYELGTGSAGSTAAADTAVINRDITEAAKEHRRFELRKPTNI